MFQAELLFQLQQKISKNTSLIDTVAMVLDISYDAAHRRTSLKSKISLDESIVLARHFNISLDRIFEVSDTHYVVVEKTKPINNEAELYEYFVSSFQALKPLLSKKDCHVLYSAKDIPLFYTTGTNLLSKFKIYVWLKLLDPGFSLKSFEQFVPKTALLESAKALGQLYQGVSKTEIWDITTVNSILKQIHFYNQARQITTENALKLCEALKELIRSIAGKVDLNQGNYQLYYNELLLMNNNVLVSGTNQQLLFVPFTILSYYLTSDTITCKQAEDYLNKQLQHSKLLNTSGEKEKQTFFNKIYTKINALQQLLEASQVLDFE